jgi:hypothetical protein
MAIFVSILTNPMRQRLRIGTMFAVSFGLLVCSGVRAQSLLDTNGETHAISPDHLAGGGAVTARALANQVNNPTAPLTLIQFRDVAVPNVPGASSPGNVFQIEPVFPIFPSRLIPFEQLVKMTLPLPTTPNPGGETGLGDLQLYDLLTLKQSWGEWGVGPSFVFPTATATALGQGKWQIGPAVGAIYTGIPNLTVGGVAQDLISFAGDSDRPAVNSLAFSPTLTYNLPQGWFAGYSDFDWTFDLRNNHTITIPVGLQFGRIVSIGKTPVSLSIEGAYLAVSPDSAQSPHWAIGAEFTVIFPTKRKQ